MDISVVIPVYNSKDIVKDCIESILGQDFQGEYEILLVDDCSTDGSYEVMQAMADSSPRPIRVLRTPSNGGYPVAMNVGIAASSGRYVARQDADDVSHPSRLSIQFAAIEKHPDIAMVSSTRYWLTPNGKPYHQALTPGPEHILENWDDIMQQRRKFTDAAAMFRRDLFDRVGGYHTYQRSGMDFDLWLRLIEVTGHPVLTLRAPLYGRRLIPGSLIYQPGTTHNNSMPRLLARRRIDDGIDPGTPPDPQWIAERKREFPPMKGEYRRVRFIVDTGVTCLRMGDFWGFLEFFRSAVLRNPLAAIRILAGALIRGAKTDKIPGYPIFPIA